MFKAPFSLTGRIRRTEYLLTLVINAVAGILTLIPILGWILMVVFFVFALCQGAKRLHDLDKSGWFILLMLVPLVNLALLIYILFVDGTPGPNQYGESPKALVVSAAPVTPVNVTVNINRDEVQSKAETKVEETSKEEKKADAAE